MRPPAFGSIALAARLAPLVALAFGGACYSGLSDFHPGGRRGDGGAAQDGGDDDGAEDQDDWDLPEAFDPDPRQIRLLSADEYRNTVLDLLGVQASPELHWADTSSGYDNGSNGQLGENLLAILYAEAERVAGEYVQTRLGQDFPCFGPTLPPDDACLARIVDDLGTRAFRRPLDAQMRDRLLDFVERAGEETDDPTEQLASLVTRMLVSPRFLYRSEVGSPRNDEPDLSVLDPFERASAIAYTITASMPDARLFADAAADRLDPEHIRGHVRRLIATPRGRTQMVRFFAQWLRVTELEQMSAMPESYPKLGGAERARGLLGELAAFVEHVVVEDEATLEELLTRPATWANRHTAPLYGQVSSSDLFEPIALDPGRRGGVLTLASVMAVHASSAEIARDKPIRRGLLLKNQLLCEEVGLPSGVDVQSAAAEVLDEVEDFDLLTTREQFELMMNQDAVCATCHATFMPYGYLWSHFDGLGQYQTHFGARPLDATVDDLMVDGEQRSYAGIMELAGDLARSEQVARCFGTQVLRHTTGLRDGALVAALSEDLAPAFGSGEITIVGLFEEILARPELYIRETHQP